MKFSRQSTQKVGKITAEALSTGAVLTLISLCALVSGCATPPLERARSNFYSGCLTNAESSLSSLPVNDKDTVLFLMERGMIRQELYQYEESTADWLKAVEIERLLETHSLTKAAGTLVINDRTTDFRGAPFEQTMLHTFLAKNYLARSMWDDSAVEARNIIKKQENRNDFPDDAYSRYVAGFCLEISGDADNAAVQYRIASALLEGMTIDDRTGHIIPGDKHGVTEADAASREAPQQGINHELVCFVLIGRSPSGSQAVSGALPIGTAPYAEIYSRGVYLGRSHPFVNSAKLVMLTRQRAEAIRTARAVTRVVIKDRIAEVLAHNNEGIEDVLRMLLFASEMPDTRRWETLPLWLEVARVPCPADLASCDVVFKDAWGGVLMRTTIAQPLTRRDRVFVSFCRDLVPR